MRKQTKLFKKRRIEGRTNYNKRLILLKNKGLRLVVRKSNRYLIMQIVESNMAQDKVLLNANTKDLLKFGWPKENIGSLKSLAAGYLGGLLLGKKMKRKIKGKIILDSGLIPSTKGSRVYAVVKGLKDGGVDIIYDENIAPREEMIKKYDFFDNVKGEIEK